MTSGPDLLSDVTQTQQAAEQISPQQAVQQSDPTLPPHSQSTDDTSVSFEQALHGIELYYNRFREVKAATMAISRVLSGEQPPPVINYPTGMLGSDNKPISVPIDFNLVIPPGRPDAERLKALTKILGPINNYLVGEFRKWLTKLNHSSETAVQLMKEADQARAPAPSPDQAQAQELAQMTAQAPQQPTQLPQVQGAPGMTQSQ